MSMVLKAARRHGWVEFLPDLSDPYRRTQTVNLLGVAAFSVVMTAIEQKGGLALGIPGTGSLKFAHFFKAERIGIWLSNSDIFAGD